MEYIISALVGGFFLKRKKEWELCPKYMPPYIDPLDVALHRNQFRNLDSRACGYLGGFDSLSAGARSRRGRGKVGITLPPKKWRGSKKVGEKEGKVREKEIDQNVIDTPLITSLDLF